MTKVKKNSKSYINRLYLKRLLSFDSRTEFERAFKKAKVELLTLEEMRKILRALLFNFFRENGTVSLLASNKIYKETLLEHFWRKRQMCEFLFEGEDFKE